MTSHNAYSAGCAAITPTPNLRRAATVVALTSANQSDPTLPATQRAGEDLSESISDVGVSPPMPMDEAVRLMIRIV